MGYLYLSIALFAGLSKGFCGRQTSRDMQTLNDCIFINLLRMLFSALIGFLLVLAYRDTEFLAFNSSELGIYTLAAASITLFSVLWMYAYKQDAYVFLNIFTMLGSIVTCLLSLFVYNDAIKWNQWVGMALLLIAVAVTSKYNKQIKGKLSVKGILILVFGCIGCAVADFSQKVYMRESGKSVAAYNFYTYLFATVLLAVIYGAFLAKNKGFKLTPVIRSRKRILVYAAMAFFLYLNTVTKTLAAGELSSAQIYPVLQGANLICSALMAHIMFKEKANLKSVTGMSVAFVGLLIMNML
jgi:drug/metabolite transporter (DMT)-like permease